MKRIYSLVLVCALAVTMFSGCANAKTTTSNVAAASSSQTSASKSNGGKTYKIAFIVKSLQSAFFINMMDSAKQFDTDHDNVIVDVLAPQTPFNIDQQIQLVEQEITNKVDAMVVVPCDTVGIVPAIKKANAAGIPVITANTKSSGGDVVSFVGVQNYDVGYQLATALCKKLNGTGSILLMEGKAGDSTSSERTNGVTDAIKKFPNIKLLDSQPADWDRAKGMTVMENWLQRYEKIDGVLTLTKDMGLGAIEAIKSSGRKDIVSVTFDIDDNVSASIKSGDLYATGNQNEKSQAYIALSTALLKLEGYQVPNAQSLPMTLVTADTLK